MRACLLLLSLVALSQVNAAQVNPLEKVIQMLGDLQGKVVKEGEAEQATYEEFEEWCEDQSKTKMYEIKTGKGVVGELNAHIEKANADIAALDSSIADASAAIQSSEGDLKSATSIRKTESADWETADKELAETVDTLDRAIGILEKALNGGSSFLQTLKSEDMSNVMDALNAVIGATGVASDAKDKLQSLIQAASGDEMDAPAGAPSAAAYESKSGAIVDMLEDMMDKAEQQRSDALKAETNAKHNFEMLKQSLEQGIKHKNQELTDAKTKKAATEEALAQSEGELAVASKDLAEDESTLKDLHAECMERAVAFETSQKERAEELKALNEAKTIIEKTSGGAGSRQYSLAQTDVSFVQTSVASQEQMKGALMATLRQLVSEHHDSRLAVLAAKLSGLVTRQSLLQMQEDPFKKVKGLITDMVTKLEEEAAKEAEHKEYCDTEMTKTKEQRSKLEETVDDLTAKIDKNSARSAQLGNEVATLQKELAELAKSQLEMDKIRSEQHEEFVVAESELKKGVEGIRLALKVLGDYYAEKPAEEEALLQASHAKSTDSAGGIIAMLEVIESDFSKSLADVQVSEEQAREEYETQTKDNQVTKATKSQDAKYKAKEQKSLIAANSELSADRSGSQTELDAVLEYWDRLQPQCVAKPETYEERKKRRESEIAGLKNALQILEGEAVGFLQKATVHRRH